VVSEGRAITLPGSDIIIPPGFKLQAMLLCRLINLVETNQVGAPLWDAATVTDPNMTNPLFLKQHIATLLQNAFGHVQP
jgi:exportin-1